MTSQNESNTQPTNSPGIAATSATGFSPSITEHCAGLIETFRRGEATKFDTIVALAQTFKSPDAQTLSPGENRVRSQALNTYLEQVNEIETDRDQNRDRVGDRDQNRDRVGEEGRRVIRTSGTGTPERHGAGERDNEPQLVQPGKGICKPRKRKQRAEAESEDDEEEGEAEPARKRLEIDESLFPFTLTDNDLADLLPYGLRRTLLLKENYMRDLGYAKQRVVCNPLCPSFPPELWKDVLAGRYVDFDKIYANEHSTSPNRRRIVKLDKSGQLRVQESKPEVRIHSHGQWNIAWDKYEQAVHFAYPNRDRELRDYSKYISRQFSAVPDKLADRVINYDRAVRTEVGLSNDLLLTDSLHFNDLYTVHILCPGEDPSRDSEGTSSTKEFPRRPLPICIKWNEDRCDWEQCRYRHVCAECGAKDHSAIHCRRHVSPSETPNRK